MTDTKSKVSHSISTESELRKVIPAYPKMLDKRIRPELDHYCLEIIEHSSIVVFGSSISDSYTQVLSCSEIEIIDTKVIGLKAANDLVLPASGRQYASMYFLMPGIGHGLRVNGRLMTRKSKICLEIMGAYVHCARAAVRAEIWNAEKRPASTKPSPDVSTEHYMRRSSFLLLKTMNSENQTELSPRGDQAGFVRMLGPDRLFIPERPGNKVAVSLRNILQNSTIELLLIVPGSEYVLNVKGAATLTVDEGYLDSAAVDGKKPKIGILIEACRFRHHKSSALFTAWQAQNQVKATQVTKFPKVLSSHMNGEGLVGKATTPVVSAIVKHDLKHLY